MRYRNMDGAVPTPFLRLRTKQEAYLNKRSQNRRPDANQIGFVGGLVRSCEFIQGDAKAEIRDGKDPHCNQATVLGSSYCSEHHRICYGPAKRGNENDRSANRSG